MAKKKHAQPKVHTNKYKDLNDLQHAAIIQFGLAAHGVASHTKVAKELPKNKGKLAELNGRESLPSHLAHLNHLNFDAQ